jgi:hypothetical protein
VDKRFCLPEAWWSDAYAARRATCNVPTALPWQSQPQLAAAMLHALTQAGLLPCQSVVADGLDGHRPDLLDAVDACVGVTTCVARPADTRCWLQAPRTEEPLSREKGEVRAKRGGWPPTTRHVPWRPWQPVGLPPVGIGGRSRKGPRGRSSLRVLANA